MKPQRPTTALRTSVSWGREYIRIHWSSTVMR